MTDKKWQEQGRDPSRLQVMVAVPLAKDPKTGRSDVRLSLHGVPDLIAAGVTDMPVPLQAFCRDFDRVPRFLDDLVQQFREATSLDRVQAAR
jgi:hypothetical protein